MKYMLIDTTTVETTRVLLVAGLREVELHGKLHRASGKTCIAPPIEGRGLAKLEKLPLQYLLWNMFQMTPPDDYEELVKQAVARLDELPLDTTPLRELERQVALICPAAEPVAEGGEPGEAPARPRTAGATGRVWVIADEVLQKRGGVIDKETRTQIIAACEVAGINAATAATQFAKWKKSKDGA